MTAGFVALTRIDLTDSTVRGHEDRVVWRARCGRGAGLSGPADVAAREIVDAVRTGGDEAVAAFTLRFERRTLQPGRFELDAAERAAACARVDPSVRAALELAASRITAFHRTQLGQPTGKVDASGALHSRPTPLRRVGVYAPGGTAAYPSSVLMTAIVAKVAGVDEVCLFTPRPADVVVLAAEIAGVDRIYCIGGAQAIAAAAFGTASIPRVDKIVGPGNAWVTAAKRHVFGACDVDGIAGPSEILVVADASASPRIVAADLISQAEHDELACAVLVTDSPELAVAVDAALREQLADLPRREIAIASLRDHGAAVIVRDRAQMVSAANDYAPEHLELLVHDPDALVDGLRTCGAIFVGAYTPEAAGDYTAGPSHVLPTAGAARFGSPLGVWDFIKHTSVLRLEPGGLAAQADAIVTLARAEGLEGHARAVLLRTAGLQASTEPPAPWLASVRGSLAALTVYDVPRSDARARMHANENPEPWPAAVMTAVGDVIRDVELGRYPDTSGRELREVIAARHGCDTARVVLGNGSDEIIALLLTTLGAAARPVLVTPSPTFTMYGHTARVLGYEIREVLLDDALQLDEAGLDRALAGATIAFFARPNNPTGTLWDAAAIERLILRHPAVVFVIDEAYIDYAPGHSLWGKLRHDNVVHMGTLSKIGLAALRVGYAIADARLAHALDKVRHPYNVSQTSIAIAHAVLTRFAGEQAALVERALANRARLAAILGRIPGVQVFDSAANFVVARLAEPARAQTLVGVLARADILVKDVGHLPKLAGCIRASVGTQAELDHLDATLTTWLERGGGA